MPDKKYRITTKSRQFYSDVCEYDYIKEENGKFLVREKTSDNWEEVEHIEELTTPLAVWENFIDKYWWIILLLTWVLCIITGIALNNSTKLAIIFVLPYIPFILGAIICRCISVILKPLAPYYKTLSTKEIKYLPNRNKPYQSTAYSSNKSKYTSSYSSSSGSGSYSGRSSNSTSSNSPSAPYISPTEMNKALKSLEEKGMDWNALANDKTDEERENLFIKEFGDKDKGKAASDRFNRTDIYPARERHLEKQINESEFEEDSIKADLQERVKSLGGEIPRKDFLNILRDIKVFQEQKKRKDNHIKYEGRLSNKDIQTIKEHLGYICMGCNLDPAQEYGESMKGILEAHHKKPFSEISEGEVRTVEPDDFLILCPTCHRMIHRLSSPDDLDGLKTILNQNKRKSWWD